MQFLRQNNKVKRLIIVSDITMSLWGLYTRLEETRLKRRVFTHFLKAVSDGADVTFSCRVFHSREVAGDRKSSFQMVDRWVHQTSDDDKGRVEMPRCRQASTTEPCNVNICTPTRTDSTNSMSSGKGVIKITLATTIIICLLLSHIGRNFRVPSQNRK